MDTIRPERRSWNMSRIRSRNTSPEMQVRRLVHGMGFRYRLHVASLPGKPDMVFPSLRKIIEVRGCFWHQHKGCQDSHVPKSRTEYWRPKLSRNKRRDASNERRLEAEGWTLLTLWECEIRNPKDLQKRLSAFLQSSGSKRGRK